YYQVSVRLSLTLPSASFRQLLTKLTLPQLMDSSISAHEGLEPFTLTSCTAHIIFILTNFSRCASSRRTYILQYFIKIGTSIMTTTR
ncbi:hypothetical protein, partial [Candidatus Bandiella numerosa]|uniref:hypothetical protein n=1 Tax=Candidatus Bandiella numerosa TaxID=2570586 RepID=UPI001F469689